MCFIDRPRKKVLSASRIIKKVIARGRCKEDKGALAEGDVRSDKLQYCIVGLKSLSRLDCKLCFGLYAWTVWDGFTKQN